MVVRLCRCGGLPVRGRAPIWAVAPHHQCQLPTVGALTEAPGEVESAELGIGEEGIPWLRASASWAVGTGYLSGFQLSVSGIYPPGRAALGEAQLHLCPAQTLLHHPLTESTMAAPLNLLFASRTPPAPVVCPQPTHPYLSSPVLLPHCSPAFGHFSWATSLKYLLPLHSPTPVCLHWRPHLPGSRSDPISSFYS